jgi:hypothetical protein
VSCCQPHPAIVPVPAPANLAIQLPGTNMEPAPNASQKTQIPIAAGRWPRVWPSETFARLRRPELFTISVIADRPDKWLARPRQTLRRHHCALQVVNSSAVFLYRVAYTRTL